MDETALFEWKPASDSIRTVLRVEGKLDGCQPNDSFVICQQNLATRPPHLISVSLKSGAIKVLADPNPSLSGKIFPRIRKIVLEDDSGNRGFANLVYPNDYRGGHTYPLVVVQYRSLGFLRGGNPGDEYPIFPLAKDGFFVLSVEMPDDLSAMRTLTEVPAMQKQRRHQAGMRSLVGSIEKAVTALISEGLVDRKRVAITGLSWGAQAVHHALQHSDLFATGIASQAAADVGYFAMFPDGEIKALAMQGMDAKTLLPNDDSQVLQTAWSPRPERLRVPLLLNLGQYEALSGYEGIAVLKAAKRPIEVRVFADEGHVKYFPKTYAGIYDNNMMWLKFWLQGEEDPRPEFHDQYQRWKAMRQQLADERAKAPTH